MDPRLLTPAEAAVLLEPRPAAAIVCVQAALLSLLGAGRISILPTGSLFQETSLLLNIATPAATLPGHLQALERALSGYGKGSRLTGSEVLHALQKAFGYGFKRYLHDEVAKSLVGRGLLVRQDSKWIGLFPRITYRRTMRGGEVAAPLAKLLKQLEELPWLMKTDPDGAIRLARRAGVLLVMSPEARKQIPALRQMIAERGPDGGSFTMAIYSEDEEGSESMLELGDMSLALDAELLLDGVEAVADFTSGGDSGSSDGGDGGGGGD